MFISNVDSSTTHEPLLHSDTIVILKSKKWGDVLNDVNQDRTCWGLQVALWQPRIPSDRHLHVFLINSFFLCALLSVVVQSLVSNSLWSHGCSTPASSVLHLSPRVCSNSCPSILCPCLWYVRKLEYPNMAAESLKKNNPWKRARVQGRSYDLVLEFTHRHFCNNLLVTQLIPSQCGRDLYKGIGGRQNSKITPKTPTSRCMCPVESSLPWV